MVRAHNLTWLTALVAGCFLALPSGQASAQCQQRGMQAGGGGMNMMQGQRGMGGGMNMMQGHRGMGGGMNMMQGRGMGGGMAMMQGQRGMGGMGMMQGGGMQMQQMQAIQQMQILQQLQAQQGIQGAAQAVRQRAILIRALQQQNNIPAVQALIAGGG